MVEVNGSGNSDNEGIGFHETDGDDWWHEQWMVRTKGEGHHGRIDGEQMIYITKQKMGYIVAKKIIKWKNVRNCMVPDALDTIR